MFDRLLSSTHLRRAVSLSLLFANACLGDPKPPSRSPSDPANPDAREAPLLPLGPAPMPAAPSAPIAQAPAADAAPHAHEHHAAADAAVVYTCPMHPEVVRDAPGSCPKCGMTLVVKSR